MKILEKGLAGLAVRRKRAGFTQQSFADALGIERARYANYEIGKAWPPASLLPGIAALLGCSIDDLYVPVAESEAGATPTPADGARDGGPMWASVPTDIVSDAEA